MKKHFLIAALLSAFTVSVITLAQEKPGAGSGKGPSSQEPDKRPQPLRTPNPAENGAPAKPAEPAKEKTPSEAPRRFQGQILGVNREARTLRIKHPSQGESTLHVDASTQIGRDGKLGSWDDLKIGAIVEGTYLGDAANAHAKTLNVGN